MQRRKAKYTTVDILYLKVEWTLEKLLKVGEGNKPWRCDWKLKKQKGFRVPPDDSLKGKVIQVLKEANQTFV